MDPVILVWYAVVCGTLAVFAPQLRQTETRALFGILTGVVAAMLAPTALGVIRDLLSGLGG